MNHPHVTIVIPTFREAENLPVLVPRLDAALTAAGLRGEILIVDDNSRDGTEEACRDLSRRHPVKLLVREHERGLSSAVIAGLKLARGDVLVVMDADLSHPPEKVPDLVAALRDPETDFVIGSRYVTGGGTADDWGLFRWLNSKTATWLAWPLTAVRDPMAGFFALRRTTFTAHSDELDPIGYKIGLELMVKCGCRKPMEVPIFFSNRLHGESKLSFNEQINYLRHLKRLYEFRYREWAYFIQFAAIGSSGMIIDLLCFVAALTFLPVSLARAVAIWVAMTWNFALNRNITFAASRSDAFLREYLSFCASCLIGAAANWGVSLSLWSAIPSLREWPFIPAMAGVASGMLFNFALCRLFVFRNQAVPQTASAVEPDAIRKAA